MKGDRIGWGVVGAAWIAGRAVLPAIAASRNGTLVAIASRSRARAERMAVEHRISRVAADYDDVLADPAVQAVYIPLVNNLHREWTLRALEAGKHVLCEKPLAMNATEAEDMAEAARRAGLHLMEAFMYRFHPRTREFVEAHHDASSVDATFGFPLTDGANYRLNPELGGGALLDVGCYTIDVARWVLGKEPDSFTAEARIDPHTHVDMTTTVRLTFPGGATASLWCSFESEEKQRLAVSTPGGEFSLDRPFSAWRDPDDPYQLMVESFADSVMGGRPVAIPLEWSIANMRALDQVRAAAGM